MQPTKTLKQLFIAILIFFTFLLIGNVLPVPFNYDVIIIIIIFLIIKTKVFFMEAKEAIDAALQGIRNGVAKVGADVKTLHDKLDAANQTGNGLTPEELADVLQQTATISESLGAIDAQTEDPPQQEGNGE